MPEKELGLKIYKNGPDRIYQKRLSPIIWNLRSQYFSEKKHPKLLLKSELVLGGIFSDLTGKLK